MNYTYQKPRGFFSRFFGGIGSLITWLRNTVLNIIFLIFLIIILAGIFGGKETKTLPSSFALVVAPSGLLVDQKTESEFADKLMGQNNKPRQTLVRDLVDAINQAANDKRVKSIVLDVGGLEGGGVSKMEEIGQALIAFKNKKKNIIAVSDNYSQDQYYLASFADQIYLHPMGEIELTGFGRYITYYKSALDKLGVTMHVFRSGKYKDYVEPYLRDNMSDESREHNSLWVNELWTQYTHRVEEQRKLEAGSLNKFINTMDTKLAAVNGDFAQLALNEKLVDKLMTRKEMDDFLIEKFGKSPEGNFYQGVSTRAYLAERNRNKTEKADKIGLLVASGIIEDGDRPEGNIGSENFIDMLRSVGEDQSIKALVIRIDSGGGSAFASELIRNEIQAVKEKGVPVYISMGSVAASGGYWIATTGDEIWAMPTTITGSIGVFGAFPTIENGLQKIGLNTDGISTTELGGAPDITRPLSPKMEKVIQSGVDHTYQNFLKIVSEARKRPVEQINEIAQGHVWTGKKAAELGLVDHLGNLNDVIAAAAERAKLKTYSLQIISHKRSFSEMFFKFLDDGSEESLLKSLIPESFISHYANHQQLKQLAPVLQPLKSLQSMTDPQGVYANCLECSVF